MTSLVITDIRKSCCDRGFDLVTAVFIRRKCDCADRLKSVDRRGILVLESATARQDYPDIGVHRGDQYMRLRAKSDLGLKRGEAIHLDGNR